MKILPFIEIGHFVRTFTSLSDLLKLDFSYDQKISLRICQMQIPTSLICCSCFFFRLVPLFMLHRVPWFIKNKIDIIVYVFSSRILLLLCQKSWLSLSVITITIMWMVSVDKQPNMY